MFRHKKKQKRGVVVSNSSDSDSEVSKSEIESSSSDDESIKKKNSSSHDSSKTNEINIINNNTQEITKCFICLNFSDDPVICRFCGNMACKKCFNRWIQDNHKCGCCRKQMDKNDLISPPIIKNLNNYIKNLNEELNREICQIHKEKILFFCMKCLKKYCGKCLYFGSEEAKKHQGHNIIDYADLKKSEYYDIINEFDKYKNTKDNYNEAIVKNDIFKEEIKTIFDNSKTTLKYFLKTIENKMQEKIDLVSKYSNDLKLAKEDLDKTYNDILINLNKLEKIDNKIENFDSGKSRQELITNLNYVESIKSKIYNIHNREIKINFKLNNFSIMKHYNEILKSKEKGIFINNPVFIHMKLIEKDEKDEKSSLKILIRCTNENTFFIFLYLKVNNQIYNFKKIENEEEDIKEDDKINLEQKNNLINIINIDSKISKDTKEDTIYISYIPKTELITSNNIFNFWNYEFSIE